MCRRSIFLSSLVMVLGLVAYASGGDIASDPTPADGAQCVDPNVVLSWSPGDYAVSHDVYLGTVFADVNNATVMSPVYRGRQASTTYNPGGLQPCTTYYWRIDEVNSPNIWKGNVWHFTTKGDDCCQCIRPPSGMVAWWPLDETVGNTSEELVNNNDGTWIGSPTPLLGEYVANSLSLGVDDYVSVPNSPELNFGTGDFSIDCWLKTTVTTGAKSFIDKRTGSVFSPTGYVMWLNAGKLAFIFGDGTPPYGRYESSLFVADGNWHLVAVTVNRDEPNGLTLYVDDLKETFNVGGHQGSLTNSSDLLMGVDIYISGNRFSGEIDEVELFNRVLGWSEILAIYQAGSYGKCKCEPGQTYTDDIKWSQPPVEDKWGCITGWDEVSIIDNNNCWNCPTQSHGDADCDGYVGWGDNDILVAAYNTQYGEPNYNPCADFDRDGDVDMQDLNIMNAYWGGQAPADSPLAGPIVADDWICMDDRPIADIHWWGSFKGWAAHIPPADKPNAFHLGIWTNVPDSISNPNDFSHPGMLIWQKVCSCYTWSYAGCDIDPRGIDQNEACFKFDQLLSQDEWFHQDSNDGNGTVYWLSIAAVYDANTPAYPWGWKTRPHFYNDDAVRIADVNSASRPPAIGAVWKSGEPIQYPAGTSWDTAFVLTANRKYEPRRGYWPPQPPISDPNRIVPPYPRVDFNGDLIINFKDFAEMAGQWLTEGEIWPEWDAP